MNIIRELVEDLVNKKGIELALYPLLFIAIIFIFLQIGAPARLGDLIWPGQ